MPASQPKSLKQRFFSAAALSIAERILTFLIQTGTTLILARILMPADFGLVGMVMPVIMVFQVMGNMGLTMAVLQRREVTPSQLSSLFYFNMSVSVVLAGVLYLSAPLISNFYDAPQVDPIAQLFSLVILLAGASALQTSLLQRELKFGAILVAHVISQIGSSVVGIWMALEGFGFMALAWRSVSQPAIYSGIVWLRSGWLPGLPEWSVEVKNMVGFGGFSAGFNLLNTMGRQIDNVLIGWRYGPHELGPYSVAYRIFVTPNRMLAGPLAQVVIPVLSRLVDDPKRYSRWFLSILRLLTLVIFPPLFALSPVSGALVNGVLGYQWSAATPIVGWLLPIAALQASYTTIGWLMLSIGRADRQMRWGLISIPVFILSFVVGLPWRAEGVAISYAVANIAMFVPAFWYATQGTPVTLTEILRALSPGVGAAIASFVGVSFVIEFVGIKSTLPAVLVACGIAAVVTLLVAIFYYGWSAVTEAPRKVRDFGLFGDKNRS
ncbi:MAG: lipopolysaccharide biosynthesis protein [Parvibaculum sp.]|nr:lipopolysaccharide biosynthesis protein [Parvibaculum sp.]